MSTIALTKHTFEQAITKQGTARPQAQGAQR